MKYYGLNIEQSLLHLKLNRQQIKPNDGFIKKLICFEMKLRKKPTLSENHLQSKKRTMEVLNQPSNIEKLPDDPYINKILPLSAIITNNFELDFVDFFHECFQTSKWDCN